MILISLAEKKIVKAMESLQNALNNLHNGNKRLAIGDLDFVKENAQEAIWILWILLDEIKDEKGEM